jgi:hypothetical protein
VEVAGVVEDVPVGVVEVHRAVWLAVEVQRAYAVAVDDLERLVGSLGPIDGLAGDGRPERSRQHHPDEDEEDDTDPLDPFSRERREREPRARGDEDGPEQQPDRPYRQRGDEQERGEERAGDAPDGPERVDVAGGRPLRLAVRELRGVGADVPQEVDRRAEQDGHREQRCEPGRDRERPRRPEHEIPH